MTLPVPRGVSQPLTTAPPPVDEAGYAKLTSDVRLLLGLDLSKYKPAQVWRRVVGFASVNGFADLPQVHRPHHDQRQRVLPQP
jgi:hypothetical protein